MEGIDFERAKTFWQKRAVNTEEQSVEGGSQSKQVVSSPGDAITYAIEPTTPAEPPSPAGPPPTPPSYTEESVSSPVPVTVAAAKLFKTFQETKFFANNSPPKSDMSDTSHEVTTPLPSVQLPDMTAWKEKVMSYSAKSTISFDKLSTQLMTSLSNVTLPDVMTSTSDQEASSNPSEDIVVKTNIQYPGGHTPITCPSSDSTESEYGELIVCEVLAAKDLAVGDFFQGESDPYIDISFRTWKRTTTVVKGTKQPVFNERFVFWIPHEMKTKEECVNITVMNRNLLIPDERLGEVQLALSIPMDEAFDEWYPLQNKEGNVQGQVRIGLRRMLLTSAALQQAGQELALQERALNDEDLATYGQTIPTLWYGFAQAAEPMDVPTVSTTDVLTNKLNDLSRRFMGIELTSSEVTPDGTRRDVF